MTIIGQFKIDNPLKDPVLPEVLCFDQVGYLIDHLKEVNTSLNYNKVREIKFFNVSSSSGHVCSVIDLANQVLNKA